MIEHGKNSEEAWLKIIGGCLRQAREHFGVSVRNLSDATDVSPSHILRIESGEFDFTITKFLRLTEALAIPHGIILEQATFMTRQGPNRACLRNEKEYKELVGDDEVDDYLLDLIEELFRSVSALILSTNPKELGQCLTLAYPPCQKTLREYSDKVDLGATNLEKMYEIHLIEDRPFKRMMAMGLFTDKTLKDYLKWRKARNELGKAQIDWIATIVRPQKTQIFKEVLTKPPARSTPPFRKKA